MRNSPPCNLLPTSASVFKGRGIVTPITMLKVWQVRVKHRRTPCHTGDRSTKGFQKACKLAVKTAGAPDGTIAVVLPLFASLMNLRSPAARQVHVKEG